jgi:heme-degrading monooxygenase HmoA
MMTVITRLTLAQGAEGEWDTTMDERMKAAEGQAGWIGGQLLKATDEPSARVIVGTWGSRDDWERWHGEEAFRETRERLEGLQRGPAEVSWYEAVLDKRHD